VIGKFFKEIKKIENLLLVCVIVLTVIIIGKPGIEFAGTLFTD